MNARHPLRRLFAALLLGLVSCGLFWPAAALAQIEHGGTPPSARLALAGSVPSEVLPPVDVPALLAQDALRAPGTPWRFGFPHAVALGPAGAGAWERLPGGGRVWRLRVRSPGARSLMLSFSRFRLPRGAELFVYDDARRVVRGAYGAASNLAHGLFSIQPTPGDALTLEYVEPAGVEGALELELGTVVHDYRGILEKGGGLGASGSCNVDVACPQGAGWEDQERAVVRILRPNGVCCSGVLLNNTSKDATPWVLSAEHCGNLDAAVFQFNWKRAACGSGGVVAQNDTVVGSQQEIADRRRDFQLVKLLQQPPAGYGVFLAGWDVSGALPAGSSVGLHHPNGDAMKISIENDPVTRNQMFWRVAQWDLGTTEGGSSGSPLFDSAQRAIGHLKGGMAACGNSIDDFYVRMDVIGPLLAPYLDAAGSGASRIDGLDPVATPPPGLGLSAVRPSTVPPLVPGTEQTVTLVGSGFSPATTVELDGVPLQVSRYSWFSNSRITVDMPQVPAGRHTFTVRDSGGSTSLPVDVSLSLVPIHQAGTGDVGDPVNSAQGIDLLYAGRVGHAQLCYWSTSNTPSVHRLGTLSLGNNFSELNFCALVTIPAQGWTKLHSQIPASLAGMSVWSQSFCVSCALPTPPARIAVSNLQEVFVQF